MCVAKAYHVVTKTHSKIDIMADALLCLAFSSLQPDIISTFRVKTIIIPI